MLTILDRYLTKQFLVFFALGLVVFATIFLAVDFMGSFARYEVSVSTLIRYYAYFLPEIVYQMIPVACLLAMVFTLSTLNKNHELVALFSMGQSLARVCAPMLILVTVVSGLSFLLGDRLLPGFTQKKNYVYYVGIKKKPGLYSTVKTNKIWYRSHNILFNIQSLNPDAGRAQGITLYYFDEKWNLIQLIKAHEVLLKGAQWILKQGMISLFAEESSFPLTQKFAEKVITMNEEVKDLQSSPHSSEVMSLRQLRKFIEKNREAGLDTLRYEVDYHSKFGFAFAGLVMALLGIPFSVSRQRSGGNIMNVGLCVGLAFLYWAFFSSVMTLGRHGLVPPILAAWGPNVIMVILSVLLLVRLKK